MISESLSIADFITSSLSSAERRSIEMEYTYNAYRRLIVFLRSKGYAFADYDNYGSYDKAVILRHDVDISLEKAVDFARLERDGGVKSTYFVLVSADFYNPCSKSSVDMMREIQSMGHDIGLHFDEQRYIADDVEWSEKVVTDKILKEKAFLESIIKCQVTVVSMHRPSRKTLESNLKIPGMVNSYGKAFFQGIKYISDSYHRWREDIYEVIESKPEKVQLLTHAFWYNEENKTRRESFMDYINRASDVAYKMLEDNILPPGVTMEESLNEDV